MHPHSYMHRCEQACWWNPVYSLFFTRILSFWKHCAHDRAWHPIIVLFMFVETINQQKYYSSQCLNSSSENKRRKQEREKEKAISISEVLFWPWFLGHSVFWEMMMPFGKCLFRWEIYFGSVVSRPSKGLTVPAVPACSPGVHWLAEPVLCGELQAGEAAGCSLRMKSGSEDADWNPSCAIYQSWDGGQAFFPALNLSFLICPISLGGWINSHTRAYVRIPQRAVQTVPGPTPRVSGSRGLRQSRRTCISNEFQVTLTLLVWDYTLRTTGLERTVPWEFSIMVVVRVMIMVIFVLLTNISWALTVCKPAFSPWSYLIISIGPLRFLLTPVEQ